MGKKQQLQELVEGLSTKRTCLPAVRHSPDMRLSRCRKLKDACHESHSWYVYTYNKMYKISSPRVSAEFNAALGLEEKYFNKLITTLKVINKLNHTQQTK